MNLTLDEIISALKTVLQDKNESPKFTEEAVANVSAKIAESIKQKNEEMKSEIAAAEEAKLKAVAEAEQLKKDLEKNTQLLQETSSKLAEIENKIAAQAQQELYSSRMSNLDSEYEFEDVDRQLLAKEVSALDNSSEAFATYKEKIAIVYRHKSKAYKTEQEKAFQEKLEAELAKRISTSTASVETKTENTVELETALANAKVENENIPVQNVDVTEVTPSWKDRISKVFDKKNITIQY